MFIKSANLIIIIGNSLYHKTVFLKIIGINHAMLVQTSCFQNDKWYSRVALCSKVPPNKILKFLSKEQTNKCIKDITLTKSSVPKKENNKAPARPQLASKLLISPLFIKMLCSLGLSHRWGIVIVRERVMFASVITSETFMWQCQ